MVKGEKALKQRTPAITVNYDAALQQPEVIGPDVRAGKQVLRGAASGKRSNLLKGFLSDNAELVGLRRREISGLRTAAEHSNAKGTISFVELRQEINGIPVFQGTAKAGFTKEGELIRVVNNMAPGLVPEELPADFGEPVDALMAAAENLEDSTISRSSAARNARSVGRKIVFGGGDSAPTAEQVYFPTEPGVAVAAWRVLIWQPVNAYYVIVDPANGTVLWRKNITDDQTQPATYSVYANPNAWLNIAHSPFPFWPAPIAPNGMQGAAIQRTPVTRIGNEGQYSFNQLGWIADGGTITDGNAVQAGIDRDGTDGIDAGGEAVAPDRNFSFDFSPLDPNTGTGEAPVPSIQTYPGTQFQQGAVTQLFYITNWFHDATYRLGFDEAAGNFQHVNFTGQGLGGDRIRAEAQDSAGTNNANFTTPADGTRGKMQMYVFTGPNPDIDGSLDGDVVIHELTHGLSNRLHGNSDGLFNDMSRAIGEGMSDFFGMAMLSHPDDPIDGLYTTGSYVTYMLAGNTNNAYYGIRRFPTAIMRSVGGPNGRPHNPLTFADMDITKVNITDGAFAPRTSGTADQVHNAGEIWCNALWEIRARMIERLGWEIGNQRIMQFVVDGMKLAPISPTFVSERDAILAAAIASGTPEDVEDIWAGFSIRGLGAAASVQDVGGTSTGGTGRARVTESFGLPNLDQKLQIAVSDETGDNDGYPEAGELVTLTVTLSNATGRLATDVSLELAGGGTAYYGAIAGLATETRQVAFPIPASAPCGGVIPITIDVNSSFGPVSFVRPLYVGKPGEVTTAESFDNVTGPDLPAGWSATAISGGTNFVLTSTGPDTPPNAMFARDPDTVGGGTDLASPPISVTSPAALLTFRHNYQAEEGWDGGVLDISVAGGDFVDITAAGGSFIQNGYNDIVGAGVNNPFGSRPAWSGDSGGYITTVVQLPAAAAGKVIHLKWRFGADDNTAETGWWVDSVSLSGAGFVTNFDCPAAPKVTVSGRVLTPAGGNLKAAMVTLTGTDGVSRRVITNSLGYYLFDDVDAGRTYNVAVSAKRYRFASKNLYVGDQLTDLDFVGLE